MTEKEKMQKQMLYDANNDSDLLRERAEAKDLCFEYNEVSDVPQFLTGGFLMPCTGWSLYLHPR